MAASAHSGSLLFLAEGEEVSSPSTSFKIEYLLGQGSFSLVYLARTLNSSRREVALKVIRASPSYRAASERERDILVLCGAQSGAAASRVRVGELLESFDHCGHLVLVLPRYGQSLFQCMRDNKFAGSPLSLSQKLLADMLPVLSFLSSKSIIHCDVKPENILFIDPSRASSGFVLVDFGSASATLPTSKLPQYM